MIANEFLEVSAEEFSRWHLRNGGNTKWAPLPKRAYNIPILHNATYILGTSFEAADRVGVSIEASPDSTAVGTVHLKAFLNDHPERPIDATITRTKIRMGMSTIDTNTQAGWPGILVGKLKAEIAAIKPGPT